jgi:SAM-dependent methyltransferase
LIVWALRSHFPGARNFFEIGCGTGFVLSGIEKEAPHLSLFGSDVHLEGLGFASKRLKRAELLQMDARRIPFEDEFDVIGAFDVLEHVEQDELVLSEMYKAACGGGGIMVTVPQHEFLWSPTDEHARHVRRYHRRELREKVERAGLEVLMITSFVSLPFPMMVLNRIMMKRKTEHDPMMELKIGGIANKVLEKTLDLERALIRLGINLPAGGSLLLIARKR